MNEASVETGASGLRCSVCHDGRGSLEACSGCRTQFHRDCRASLATCPTIGCRVVPAPPRVDLLRPARAVPRWSAWALRAASLALFAANALCWIVAASQAGRWPVVSLVALAINAAFQAMGSWAWRAHPGTPEAEGRTVTLNRSYVFLLVALFFVGVGMAEAWARFVTWGDALPLVLSAVNVFLGGSLLCVAVYRHASSSPESPFRLNLQARDHRRDGPA